MERSEGDNQSFEFLDLNVGECWLQANQEQARNGGRNECLLCVWLYAWSSKCLTTFNPSNNLGKMNIVIPTLSLKWFAKVMGHGESAGQVNHCCLILKPIVLVGCYTASGAQMWNTKFSSCPVERNFFTHWWRPFRTHFFLECPEFTHMKPTNSNQFFPQI